MRTTLFAACLLALIPAQQDPAPPAQDPPTHKVARGTLSLAVDAEGTFAAQGGTEVRLRFKAYQGELRITQLAAHGARVKAGDVVIAIDGAAAKKQLAQAQGDLDNARANHAKAEADAKIGEAADALAMLTQERELRNAEQAAKTWDEMGADHFRKRADMGMQWSRDNVADQEEELDQLKKMYKSEELTNQTADIVLKRAIRQLERSKTSLEMSEKEHKREQEIEFANAKANVAATLERARQAMAGLKAAQEHGRVLRRTGLAASKAALDAAEERFADLKADTDALTVRAEADAVVLHGHLQMGQWVAADPRLMRVGEQAQPQQVLATLFTPGKMTCSFDVPETQLFWIKPGMKAQVVPAAVAEGKVDGTIGSISPTGMNKGAGQSFECELSLPAVDARLMPGMKASVHLPIAELKDVLLVPATAVSRGRVWVRKDGKDEVRDVAVGKSDGQMTEITSGVAEGDAVLVQAKK